MKTAPLILASGSPRRQFLLHEIGFDFRVEAPNVDESFPVEMPVEEIAKYLAKKKASVFEGKINDEIVITSDTIVILDKVVLNKPANRTEAISMLKALSGKTHRVITAVNLFSRSQSECFDDTTQVTFTNLSDNQIELYIDYYQPFDKAGAYGAQDCLAPGYNPCSTEELNFLNKIDKADLVKKSLSSEKPQVVVIKKIEGSYFTVMGFPIHKVYEHLIRF